MSTHSKVIAQTDRQTHTHTHTHTHDENITSTAFAGGKKLYHTSDRVSLYCAFCIYGYAVLIVYQKWET